MHSQELKKMQTVKNSLAVHEEDGWSHASDPRNADLSPPQKHIKQAKYILGIESEGE